MINKFKTFALINTASKFSNGQISFSEAKSLLKKERLGVCHLKDATKYGVKDITNEKDFTTVVTCLLTTYGVNGMNGALFADCYGHLFVITARTSNLFALI